MSADKSTDSILPVVKDYSGTELLNGDEVELEGSTDLIEQGVIDSMSLLRLISFVEERFGIQLADEEIVPQNFRSLDAIQALIARTQTKPQS